MFDIIELLEPSPESWWPLLRQVGISRVVSLLEDGEQRRRWLLAVGRGGDQLASQEAPPAGARSWELPALQRLRDLYAGHGFELVGLEDTPPLDLIRLGRRGRDEQIEWFCDQLRAMSALGLRTLCYNWMPVSSWARSDTASQGRGGALVTAYDAAAMRQAPRLLAEHELTHEQLWDNLAYFLSAVVPIAEERGVQLAIHPDDPPVAEVRGVPRIMGSGDAYDRMLAMAPSDANGITLCQGNFTLMTQDLPATIRHFAARTRFVHFRDVRGTTQRFVETFHDEGPADHVACMAAYRDVGFNGIMRPDHVPTLAGESNAKPGYAGLGRLHAIGYLQGLRRAAFHPSNQ